MMRNWKNLLKISSIVMGRIKQDNLFKNMDETTQQNASDSDLLVYYLKHKCINV